MNEKRLNQRGGVCVHYKKQVKERWYTCMDKLFGCLVVWLFGCLVVCFSSCCLLIVVVARIHKSESERRESGIRAQPETTVHWH